MTVALACALAAGCFCTPVAAETVRGLVVAAAPQRDAAPAADTGQKELTPEEKMSRRFPQPVRVGFLVGLPVLDWEDSTIGFIQQVVRTPDGKIKLIVPYYPRFGWVRDGGFLDRWRRPVAVPIETVAILARQVDALDC
ncbi:MAG: hypothetical protein WCG92_14940 [Hyphomicrobiales bacterium]|nr:hypothetical protein [Alphaproteobacteria bacterium]